MNNKSEEILGKSFYIRFTKGFVNVVRNFKGRDKEKMKRKQTFRHCLKELKTKIVGSKVKEYKFDLSDQG